MTLVSSLIMGSLAYAAASGVRGGLKSDPPSPPPSSQPAGTEIRWLKIATRDPNDPSKWIFRDLNAGDPNAGAPMSVGSTLGGPFLARLHIQHDQPDLGGRGPQFRRGRYNVLLGPDLANPTALAHATVHASTPQVLLGSAGSWQLVSGELPGGSSGVVKTGALGVTASTWVIRVMEETVGSGTITAHYVYNINLPSKPGEETEGDNREVEVRVVGHSTPIVLRPQFALRVTSTGVIDPPTPLGDLSPEHKQFLEAVYRLATSAGISTPYRFP